MCFSSIGWFKLPELTSFRGVKLSRFNEKVQLHKKIFNNVPVLEET